MGLERKIALSVLIETAMGMVKIEEIASACPERMEAMVFGVADYAASLQSHTTSIGGTNPDYAMLADREEILFLGQERERHLGDQWHYALSRIAVVCRAYGLRPIDGPFGDFTDPEGYMASARRAAVLGYEGKWAIHPSQIALANDVFTPSDDIARRTRRIVAAMEEAAAQGKGAVSLDGRLIDAASIRMAQNLLAKLDQIEARGDRRAAAAPRGRLGARRGELLADPGAEQRGVDADGDHAEAGLRAGAGLLAAAVAVHAGDDPGGLRTPARCGRSRARARRRRDRGRGGARSTDRTARCRCRRDRAWRRSPQRDPGPPGSRPSRSTAPRRRAAPDPWRRR